MLPVGMGGPRDHWGRKLTAESGARGSLHRVAPEAVRQLWFHGSPFCSKPKSRVFLGLGRSSPSGRKGETHLFPASSKFLRCHRSQLDSPVDGLEIGLASVSLMAQGDLKPPGALSGPLGFEMYCPTGMNNRRCQHWRGPWDDSGPDKGPWGT